jgi:hypothetical protein
MPVAFLAMIASSAAFCQPPASPNGLQLSPADPAHSPQSGGAGQKHEKRLPKHQEQTITGDEPPLPPPPQSGTGNSGGGDCRNLTAEEKQNNPLCESR